MPGLLSRSRSMRMLKGHRKEVQHEQAQQSMPHNIDSYMSATAIPRAEAKLHTPDMVVRPNTSAGTGDRTTLFHMKTTADSSTLSQNNLTFFLPTDSTTNFYTAEPTDSREGIIGIALGSPTTSHWASTPQARTLKNEPPVAATSMSAYAHSDRFPSPEPRRQALPKSKLSRWKSLFRKATPPLPQSDKPAFYQLTTTITATRAVRADSHHDDDSMISQVDLASHDTGRTPSPPCFKPNIRASRTFATPRSTPELPRTRERAFTAGALPANPRASVQRSATTPAPFSFAVSEPRNLPRPSIVTTNSDMTGTSLLDVDIPDIKLDRYSVMFNNLLQPSSDRPSSLLARRQGNVDKLKPLDALAVKHHDEQERPMNYKLQRRATSPIVPSPSPRLSLFPSTNTRAASPSVSRSKVLYRSKTERSPLRQSYSRAEMTHDNQAQDLFIRSKPVASPNLQPHASTNLKVQQLAITPTSVHSFESEADSITLVVGTTTTGQSLHLDDREPDWELCAKPTPKPPSFARANTTPILGIARTPSQRQPAVTKLSALSSHAPSSAPLQALSPLQRIQQLQSPPASAREKRTASENRGDGVPKAMVGVARSVSVSRANSPRAVIKSPGEGTGEMRGMGEGKCLTPTMVDVKQRQRRSHMVQLVDA